MSGENRGCIPDIWLLVMEQQYDWPPNQELDEALYALAEQVVDHAKLDADKDEAVDECMAVAYAKLKKLDLEKASTGNRVRNYLTTSMLCHLRQVYRKVR